MLEILRDPAWQFVGILVGAAIAVWIYLAQRVRSQLSFGTLSSRALLTVHDTLSNRVTVALDGEIVRDVHLLVFAFKNSGNRPISPTSFATSVTFTFGSAIARVLTAEITRRFPDNLDATIEVKEDKVTLRPLLLNPVEYIIVQALVSGQSPKVLCDVRVEGISRLKSIATNAPEERSFTARIGAIVLSLPFNALLFWFIVSAIDAVFDAKLGDTFTVNGSLAFGLVAVSLVISTLQEVASWFKATVLGRTRRAVNDA